jgi:hypothetical protein
VAVELSFDYSGRPSREPNGLHGSLELWALAVGAAVEPCLVVESTGKVVAASPGCGALFSIADVAGLGGLRLVDEVLDLRDFSASSAKLPDREIDKVPPLMAITSKGLARGLLRVKVEGETKTVDAISVPLGDRNAITGSLTFFAQVNR